MCKFLFLFLIQGKAYIIQYWIFVVHQQMIIAYFIMSLIIFPVTLTQVFASQMEAALFPTLSESTPVYTSIKFVTINYEPGSALSQIFDGLGERFTISANSTTDGMDDVLKDINTVIFERKKQSNPNSRWKT